MSELMLHIQSPGRWDGVAGIVGDRDALQALREAPDDALATGSGGAFAYSSDGEGYALAVALQPTMYQVHTAYAGELSPERSLREMLPLRGVANFLPGYCKALEKRDRGLDACGEGRQVVGVPTRGCADVSWPAHPIGDGRAPPSARTAGAASG